MNSRNPVTTVRHLLKYLETASDSFILKVINGCTNLDVPISVRALNRPGINLLGFFKFFAHDRLQVFGRGESAFLHESFTDEKATEKFEDFFSHQTPGIIFTSDMRPPDWFLKMSQKHSIPVMQTPITSIALHEKLEHFFTVALTPRITVKGVMMELYGMGILLEGASAIGKSECALELIERGHRFISDDIVEVRLVDGQSLIASSSDVIKHHMEISGIGIINIAHLFGVGAIRNECQIDLIITFEHYQKDRKYERTGLDTKYQSMLGVEVTNLLIPIYPGSSMPVLVEIATMNHRLKSLGYNPAKEFNKKLKTRLEYKKKG